MRGFGYQVDLFFSLWFRLRIARIVVVLRRVWIWPLDLYKTFGAYRLITASCLVEMRRVVQEADGAFCCIFVEVCFYRLPIHVSILG